MNVKLILPHRLAQKIKWAYCFPMSKERAYHSDPEILGGMLVFKGTRVPVQSLFDHLKAGDSIEVFLDGFPSVKRAQVLAVLKEMETEVLAHTPMPSSAVGVASL
jgi:uncharacterized protein (DUF433 family)